MNTECPELLFGPYRPPLLMKDDRAMCLDRDRDVVIVGWSDAPISWPLCSVPRREGCLSPFVEEELARAICHESAQALYYWWGVSKRIVTRWRKNQGITRMDSEGSCRLILAASEHLRQGDPTGAYETKELSSAFHHPAVDWHNGTVGRAPRWGLVRSRLLAGCRPAWGKRNDFPFSKKRKGLAWTDADGVNRFGIPGRTEDKRRKPAPVTPAPSQTEENVLAGPLPRHQTDWRASWAPRKWAEATSGTDWMPALDRALMHRVSSRFGLNLLADRQPFEMGDLVWAAMTQLEAFSSLTPRN